MAYNNELPNEEKPHAYRVEDDDNLTEENLKKKFLSGEMKDADASGMESQGAGGHKFGEENNTNPGDDKNNPSQLAGNTNAYFNRTEPSDEHPEDTNFKAGHQDGEPSYVSAKSTNDISHHDEGGD